MSSDNDNQDIELSKLKSHQLNLNLFGLDPMMDQNYSNALEIYDLAGKFVYDKERKYQSRVSADESAFSRKTTYKGQEVNLTITTANIERKVGGKMERTFVFPSAREEIIEDVLRKFATQSRAEGFEVSEGSGEGTRLVGVKFTLYEVYTELKRIGKSYSYSEISEALEIMNNANLKIRNEDGSIDLSAPFFPILATAEKGDKKDRLNFACFHPMVTETILTLNYRRYNYAQALGFSSHYTRLVYRRLCLRWVQASPTQPYTILLSTLISAIKEPYANLYQDKQLFTKVFDDLKKDNILLKVKETKKVDPENKKKILDWRFDLYATESFAKQVASNNKVQARTKGLSNGTSEALYIPELND